jgi:septal ring factor EnvC (AmiA/AmiB activator)
MRLWIFVLAVWHHWEPLVLGGVVGVVIFLYEHRKKEPIPWRLIGYIIAAALLVSCFSAWKDQYTSAEWRGAEIGRLTTLLQAKNDQIGQLQDELRQKDRPIVLQTTTDPEIIRLLNQQERELARLKTELPSPKKRALQASNDLLRFLTERERAEPTFPIPDRNMTPDEFSKQQQAFEQAYEQWMNETRAESQTRFAVPLAQVLQDMRAENIDVGRAAAFCSFFNGNLFGIQGCATDIGVLAQKLSH